MRQRDDRKSGPGDVDRAVVRAFCVLHGAARDFMGFYPLTDLVLTLFSGADCRCFIFYQILAQIRG